MAKCREKIIPVTYPVPEGEEISTRHVHTCGLKAHHPGPHECEDLQCSTVWEEV